MRLSLVACLVVTACSPAVKGAFMASQPPSRAAFRQRNQNQQQQQRPGARTELGVAIDTSDIKNGLTVELDGEPYKVLNFSIMKQARGAAKTTIKFKNLMRGNTIENTYRSGEKFETAMIEKVLAQFTYQDGVSWFGVEERGVGRTKASLRQATSKAR